MNPRLSRWTMPILRIGMGVFLAMWGLDKVVASEGAARIFAGFYGMEDLGSAALLTFGVAEILLAAALAAGLFRVAAAWIQLGVNAVSTFTSWRQILDPWGFFGLTEGGTHLFLASIVIMAVSVVLVLNARDDTWTLDRKLGRTGTPELK
ncbi:MAG: hypothetical protein ACOC5J_02210 [Gemmatimonadota bacterium]